MTEYLNKIHQISDNLADAGSPLSDPELIVGVLGGFPSDYNTFSTYVRVRSVPVTVEELHSLLISEEITLKEQAKSIQNSESSTRAFLANHSGFKNQNQNPNQRFYNQKGKGRGKSGQSNNNSGYNNSGSRFPQNFPNFSQNFANSGSKGQSFQSYNNGDRPICQICHKIGHTAAECYHRMNFSYQGRAPPQNLSVMLASANLFGYNPWYADSGASSHLTPDATNIQQSAEFEGSEKITTANGQDFLLRI